MGMGTRRRRQRQEQIWIAHQELAKGPAHPFYQRVNELLEEKTFDEFAERECAKFYAGNVGRPSLAPGIYFRLLLVGYFEGIDSQRGIAWRVADSLGLCRFLGIGIDEQTPDHSTISRTRRLIDVETHHQVFMWILGLLRDRGLVKGKTVGIDATTLEANAAMRSIVRRDGGESYEEFFERAGQGIGHRDAHARRLGPPGSETEEQGQQRRLGESARSRRADYEDERWADASGAQSRARRGHDEWRGVGGDSTGSRCGRHDHGRRDAGAGW